jgi:hypothetical protein
VDDEQAIDSRAYSTTEAPDSSEVVTTWQLVLTVMSDSPGSALAPKNVDIA